MSPTTTRPRLVVIGDLIEDVIVKLDGALQLGHNNLGIVKRSIGGSASNVARVAAESTFVRFVGRVGVDRVGDDLIAELEATGVEVCVQREGRTGSVVIIVDHDGDRTMVPDRGSGKDLDLIDREWLSGFDWLHCTGYGLVTQNSTRALVAAAKQARESGAAVSIDLASTHILDELSARNELYGLVDEMSPNYVFANEDELKVLDRKRISAERYLIGMHGPDPVTVEINGAMRAIEIEPVPDVVDTTGAGDAFVAGFISARMRDETIDNSTKSGAMSARAAILRLGA